MRWTSTNLYILDIEIGVEQLRRIAKYVFVRRSGGKIDRIQHQRQQLQTDRTRGLRPPDHLHTLGNETC